MPTLIIDGKEINVKPGTTIMEAARQLGVHIPHFCYHPKLSISGNCRMCLVEVEKMPKPVVACAMPVNDGMVVRTNSEMVQEARRGVMELLLINHPLDCPVCDQGGECDLQDFAMKYGPDRARFSEPKRQVPDKDLGPLIETVMNRCIQCTRCIRFSEEVAGVEEMGATYRGDHMTVGTYVEKSLSSELAGNLFQLCPVGALNSKPFHFQARSWELQNAAGICNHCAVGCHVNRQTLSGSVKRVMGAPCEEINQAWLCDKGRFSYDGLGVDRITTPLVKGGGGQTPASWQEALDKAAELLKGVKPEEVAGLADERMGAEELFAFQDLLRHGVETPHIDHRLRQRDFSGDDAPLTRADLLMNTALADLERADFILLVGADPRHDAPLLNLRLRKAARAGARVVGLYPRTVDANLPGIEQIPVAPGAEVAFLTGMVSAGGDPAGQLGQAMKAAERPLVLLGDYAINHPRAEDIRRQAVALAQTCGALGPAWNGYNRVVTRGNAAAAQDLGVVPHRGPGYARLENRGRNAREILEGAAAGEIKVLFLLGCDPAVEAVDTALARAALSKARVIFLGSHKTPAAATAEVVLAGTEASEKAATFTNCEGRAQRSGRAVPPPGECKEEWRILRALSDRFPTPLGYNTLEALRAAMAAADHRYNVDPDELPRACDHSPVTTGLKAGDGALPGGELLLVVEPDFYHDDPVSRRSATMAKLDQGSLLRLSAADAERNGIDNGQKVRVIQGERTVELTARVSADVPPGVAFAGYGHTPGLAQDVGSWEGGYAAVSLAAL